MRKKQLTLTFSFTNLKSTCVCREAQTAMSSSPAQTPLSAGDVGQWPFNLDKQKLENITLVSTSYVVIYVLGAEHHLSPPCLMLSLSCIIFTRNPN